MEQTVLLFVYGTLLKGESNHERLAQSPCISEAAWVEGNLYDTGCGYPALVLTQGNLVAGELYEVSESVLRGIDALEGYYGELDPGNYYDRVKVRTTDEQQVERVAITYVFKERKAGGLYHIESGDWRIYGEEGR